MIWLAFLLWFIPFTAFGATVYIGNNTTGTPVMTASGTTDNYMQEQVATTNFNTTTFYTQRYNATDRINFLLKFDLSSITGPVTVSSATIWINLIGHELTSPATVEFHRLLRNWVTTEVTWTRWAVGNNWTTGGANGDGTDRVATISASGTVTGSDTVYYSFTGAQLANDVENIINGVNPNYGWLGQNPLTEIDAFKRYYESSHADTNHRPYIEITYTPAGGGGSTVVRHKVIQ